jgi:HEAT repeat protein
MLDDPDDATICEALRILDDTIETWGSHPDVVVGELLRAIGELRLEAGRPYLLKFLSSDVGRRGADEVIGSAAIALGKLGGANLEIENAVRRAQEAGASRLLESMAIALGVSGDPAAVSVLEGLLDNKDPMVVYRTLSALTEYCSPTSRGLVERLLADEDQHVVRGATW